MWYCLGTALVVDVVLHWYWVLVVVVVVGMSVVVVAVVVVVVVKVMVVVVVVSAASVAILLILRLLVDGFMPLSTSQDSDVQDAGLCRKVIACPMEMPYPKALF